MAHAPHSAHAVNPGSDDVDTARKPGIDWNREVKRLLSRTSLAVFGSHKVAAAELGVDDGDFGKWANPDNDRRPQIDRVLACDELRVPFVLGLCRLARLEVVMQVRDPGVAGGRRATDRGGL